MTKRLVGLGVIIAAIALSTGTARAQVKKAEILAAIKAAFTTWEGVSCSGLKFNYAGPLSSYTAKKDGGIVINFAAEAADWTHLNDAVYTNSHYGLDSKGDITDASLELNAVQYKWSLGKDAQALDIQTVVTRLIPMTIGFYVGYHPTDGRVAGLLNFGAVDHALLDLHKTGAQYTYFKAGTGCSQPLKPVICGMTAPQSDAGVSDASTADAAVADASTADASTVDAGLPLQLCIHHSLPNDPTKGQPYHWESQPIQYWVYIPDKGKLPGSTNTGGDGGLDGAAGGDARQCYKNEDCPAGQTCLPNGQCSGGGGEEDDGCCRVAHTRAENVTYSVLLLLGLALLIRRSRRRR